VAAACSGLRSLLATVGFSMGYAFLSFPKWWKRLAVIAAAFPLAVLGNLIRMLTIVIAAEIWGQKAGDKVHDGGPLGIYSLIPYVLAFAGLLLLGHWLREREPEKQPSMEPPSPRPSPPGEGGGKGGPEQHPAGLQPKTA